MIPVFKPKVNMERALELLRGTFESGWLGQGPRVEEFEQKVAKYLGVKHFIATSSCTAALHMGVRSLKLLPGTKVLTTPITFVSTNMALLYERLVPVFGTVEPLSGNLDANCIERAVIEHNVKAVVVVHMGGWPCDMEAIHAVCDHYHIPVLQDCAHAFGSKCYGGSMAAQGDTCCWSFHAVKNLGIGDGGGVSTDNDELAEQFKRTRWMGISKTTHERTSSNMYVTEYDVKELGFKYHMNDVAACVGLAQLETVDEDNRQRRRICLAYQDVVESIAVAPIENHNRVSSCHFRPFFFDRHPAILAALLRERCGISTSRHYAPNFLYPVFERFPLVDPENKAAFGYYDHALVLPVYPTLSLQDQNQVIDAVSEWARVVPGVSLASTLRPRSK